jgi:VanZ family protein
MWYCSSIPGGSFKTMTLNWASILYHFVIFFLFSFFFLMTITKDKIETKKIVITIIVSLIISILDEFHQSFVPGRNPAIKDILIDLTGTIFLVTIVFFKGILNYK